MKKLKDVIDEFEGYLYKNPLEDSVIELLAKRLDEFLSVHAVVLDECETPIEKMLAIPLLKEIKNSKLHHLYKLIELDPQRDVITAKGKYRVDFIVSLIDSEKPALFFAIECDGHDFHEKTKEQARNDKSRERALQEKGYIVIRFTGSEIYDDADGCAKEVLSIINKFAGDYSIPFKDDSQ